ncbi:glycosyltransferase family 4 protein [Paenibacillus hexagrammi]|uniref:Glycosyltransferase family 4 protein n=1 Tax=Paenibacillus hexagrammi TaxID=2908839 RepID=A0ABY3SFU6_9BACL|nr:glycosyltransferase family 4 protein [Paenibacillus sp. YPD9-1]UJF32786.1 glycosyltransferase family 4 protein [Paenibacillus sp. YPD9-1]
MGGSEKLLLHMLRELAAQNDSEFQHHICVIDGSGTLLSEFQATGFPTVYFMAKHGLDVKEIGKFIRYLRSQPFDIIHFHSIISTIVFAWLFNSAHIIRSDHGGRLLNTKGWKLKRDRWVMRFIDLLINKHIAVSNLVNMQLQHTYNIASSKIEVIHNGILVRPVLNNRQYLRKQLNLNEDDFVVGVVARLLHGKGVQYVIHAIKLLIEQGVACKLVIVGEGPYRGELEHITEQLSLNEYVQFTGLLTDTSEIYTLFDTFVFSSIWQESFGMTLLEALSAGIPLIAFNRGAVSEIITDGFNGFLIEPSSEELAEKILFIQRDLLLRRSLKANALQSIQDRFRLETKLNRLLEVYREVSRR